MKGLILILATGLAVCASDSLGAMFKELIARERPCHALINVRDIASCSNSFSFPSNHAINSFTVATIVASVYRNLTFFLYVMALLIGYSRVYLGVHYPSDVLVGALCGTLIGYIGYKLVYLKMISYLKTRFSRISSHEQTEAKVSNH